MEVVPDPSPVTSQVSKSVPTPVLNLVSGPVPVGPNPCPVICPACKASIITTVKRETGIKTHFMSLLLCNTCCLLCSCIPYCMNSCKNADHYCPNCGAFLGSYKR